MAQEILTRCPICSANDFNCYLKCRDYTTSNEIFQLQQCTTCQFVITNPRPDNNALINYYLSEKYISHTGKSAGIIDWIYLIARNFTLRGKIKLVEKYNSKPLLLDYGCGTGEFLDACSTKKWTCYGIEPSHNANAKAASLNRITICKAIDELPKIQFDVITLWHVLEHVSELNKTIKQLKSLLAENGTLIVAVPNRESYDAQVYKEHWAAYDVPRHLWHFSKKNIADLTSTENLKIISHYPMKLDSYYVSMLSEKYLSGKTTISGLTNAFKNGLLSNLKAAKTYNHSSLIYIIKK